MNRMVKIDLITGFLGAGKTTFLKKYAQYWMEQGCQIGILENDYGAVNVDMMLLQDLEGEQCELEMVAGACDYDCHKRRFKSKLISMGMCGYDRVLVEPSGIYDVDEFFDTLCEEPLDRWYEIGNVIAIVDAALEENLSAQSEYLLACQIANAGMVVLSKSQEATKEAMGHTIGHLNQAMEQVQCRRRFGKEVLAKDWEQFTAQDWAQIASCGYVLENYVKQQVYADNGYTSLYYMNLGFSEAEVLDRAKGMFQDPDCGQVFRIKGFFQREDGSWMECNATRDGIGVNPIEKGQDVLIIIGEDLKEEVVKRYWTVNEMGLSAVQK